MSAIKDLYDLGKNLKESIRDRKTLDLIMPILDKIHEAKIENFELEKSQFELERKHHDEMTQLKSLHSDEVAKLNSKISSFETELKSKTQPSISTGRVFR